MSAEVAGDATVTAALAPELEADRLTAEGNRLLDAGDRRGAIRSFVRAGLLRAEQTLDNKAHDRIGRLERRAVYLRQRITANPDKDLTYDRAELSALDWAIPMLYASSRTETAKRIRELLDLNDEYRAANETLIRERNDAVAKAQTKYGRRTLIIVDLQNDLKQLRKENDALREENDLLKSTMTGRTA